MPEARWIVPDWPAPAHVRAAATTRLGGISRPPFDGLNLADHVGDAPDAVRENRRRLRQALELPSEPCWLRQQHGTSVHDAATGPADADASFALQRGIVCAVQTADCLPVLLCSRRGDWVAAVHAGWRGLAGNILQAAVDAYPGEPAELMAWLGPCISAKHYEVDEPVRALLDEKLAAAALREGCRPGHWQMDLPAGAAWCLARAGVVAHFGCGLCTYEDAQRFFSHRRDPRSGRMAALVWMA